MKIEIWSDIECPFCYIGKRHLEAALEKFPHREQVEIKWKSFELDPHASKEGKLTTYEMLSKKYGMTIDEAKQTTAKLAEKAKEVGLNLDFDRTIPANSFDAHRLIHLASSHGMQDQAQEKLFAAHFIEGKNISDHKTLLEVGNSLGLDSQKVGEMLKSDLFASEVRKDESEAAQFGIRGVPFFLVHSSNGGKYTISGAQPVEIFQKALQMGWENA